MKNTTKKSRKKLFVSGTAEHFEIGSTSVKVHILLKNNFSHYFNGKMLLCFYDKKRRKSHGTRNPSHSIRSLHS
jgi:hypothetical protein